jgi:hypothetical protein
LFSQLREQTQFNSGFVSHSRAVANFGQLLELCQKGRSLELERRRNIFVRLAGGLFVIS